MNEYQLCINKSELNTHIYKHLVKYCPRKFKKPLKWLIYDVADAYNGLPYHNIYHGCEVMLSCMALCKNFNIPDELTFLTCLCALCHDIGHVGPNIKTTGRGENDTFVSEINLSLYAIEHDHIFNERSVNEKHHIAQVLVLNTKYELHKYVDFPKSFIERFFNNIIFITDVENAIVFRNTLRDQVVLDPATHPISTSALLVTCSDVGHFSKSFVHHSYWFHRCLEENGMLDFTLYEMSTMNLNFIEDYVSPLFNLLYIVATKSYKPLVCSLINNLNRNRRIWAIYGSCRIDNMSSPSDTAMCVTKHMKNVCICMIDIVNFSRWCSFQCPNDIFDTMTKYNAFLSNHIAKRTNVEKIELVGDSVLIIGGFDADCVSGNSVMQILHLVRDILQDIDAFREIFTIGNESFNSLRVGIHVGDIYSGFIRNPCKYQVFGNAINVASRLEGTAVPGAFSISLSAMSHINTREWEDFRSTIHIGKVMSSCLKGVGRIQYCNGFLFNNSILIADDDMITLEIMKVSVRLYSNHKCVVENNLDSVFERLRESTYWCVLLDVHFDTDTIFDTLRKFRIWESVCRTNTQNVYLVSSLMDKDSWWNEDDVANGLYQGFVDKKHIGDKGTWGKVFS